MVNVIAVRTELLVEEDNRRLERASYPGCE
jgi:hypothetical protein